MLLHGVRLGRPAKSEVSSAMASMARALVSGLSVLVVALTTSASFAQQAAPSVLGRFGTGEKWTAWTVNDPGGLICYISASPDRSEPSNVLRDPISFIVVHRKGPGTRNEIQSQMGYPLNAQPNASAAIDGKVYQMVAEAEGTWLADMSQEPAFVEDMKKGAQLVVRGTSQRGTNTVDYYSLSGVTAAMAAIDNACA
jgi:hypothetical protein